MQKLFVNGHFTNGWALLDEVILEEDEKIYEVLVLQRGEMKLTEVELLLGQHLLIEKSEVFIEKWSEGNRKLATCFSID